MLLRIRRAMTFANVCSVLALAIALGTGTAYAANTVFSTDIVNGEVKAVDIHALAVTAGKLQPGAVDGVKVADGSLSAADLGTGSVGSDEIAANAVTGEKIANDSITTADIAGVDATGSVSISAIANGRCANLDFGIGGAQVGQVPLVWPGAAMQSGVFMYAQRVSSAGHVVVAFCNLSGGAMNPISGLPIRVITFG